VEAATGEAFLTTPPRIRGRPDARSKGPGLPGRDWVAPVTTENLRQLADYRIVPGSGGTRRGVAAAPLGAVESSCASEAAMGGRWYTGLKSRTRRAGTNARIGGSPDDGGAIAWAPLLERIVSLRPIRGLRSINPGLTGLKECAPTRDYTSHVST
jgi:hypothetical protein